MDERDASEAFSHVYETDHWSGGSGVGSRRELNDSYRNLVQRLITTADIETVVDAGCGDWQFSQLIDWSSVTYQGFDVVDSVVASNKDRFTKSNVSFGLRDFSKQPLPKADLLLCKDVLQHWPIENVFKFLDANSKRFRYMLVTNDVASVHCEPAKLNSDVSFGEWRTLDLEAAPFKLRGLARAEFDYMNEWTKRSVLFCSTIRSFFARRSSDSVLRAFRTS